MFYLTKTICAMVVSKHTPIPYTINWSTPLCQTRCCLQTSQSSPFLYHSTPLHSTIAISHWLTLSSVSFHCLFTSQEVVDVFIIYFCYLSHLFIFKYKYSMYSRFTLQRYHLCISVISDIYLFLRYKQSMYSRFTLQR